MLSQKIDQNVQASKYESHYHNIALQTIRDQLVLAIYQTKPRPHTSRGSKTRYGTIPNLHNRNMLLFAYLKYLPSLCFKATIR